MTRNCKYICMLPVGRQLVGDETSRDLSYDVAPEEGAVDQSHCLWVPVKLSFLERKKRGLRINFTNTNCFCLFWRVHTHTHCPQKPSNQGCKGTDTPPEEQGSHWQRRCCCWPSPQWPHRGCSGCQRRCRSPNRWGWRWCSAWANLHSCSPETGQDVALLPLDAHLLSAQNCLLLLHYCHLFS